MFRKIFVLLCVVMAGFLDFASADDPPPVQEFLTTGRLQAGADAMEAMLRADPDDQQARFSLGIVEFLQAIEGLGQDHHRYGLTANRWSSIMFMRLPVPENPDPERISYADARAIVQRIVNRLAIAEKTLQLVESSDLHVTLPLETARLDLDGSGQCSDEESLGSIIAHVQRGRRNAAKNTETTVFSFDVADAVWLRGYCNALSAVGELILAYDWQDQFERTAHLFFPDVKTPYDFLNNEDRQPGALFGARNIGDFVALFHTINYDIKEPHRMQKALGHLQSMIRLSRESWKLIESETDDEGEWLPNASQTAVVTRLRVGQQLIGTWHEFLDEVEEILQGKKLVPFWRGISDADNDASDLPRHPTLGINVRRIFTEPGRFDASLWLQGTGLKPWLEEGDIVEPTEWRDMVSGFNNNFWPVVFWFN